MKKVFLVLLCILLGLADCPATVAAGFPAADHHPRYKSYKYRGQSRKRNQRRGLFSAFRHKTHKPKPKRHRGVIKVGDLNGTMPAQ
ncbi:hypothetical protein ACFQ48_06120 [Hymenobacter caeli]|uniref:Uncharacterized protein n=1 Tax=Hymenobacter caeli TaxID=2735894 RepID=A0ABX2FQT1_9BACT|nr:hypothetical protein [Hymenobacter caeli]NRT18754.1 hypothetical protein [Hymenobacter caeli]